MADRHGSCRPPAVAGTFYPANRDELLRILDADLARAEARSRSGTAPKAILVPHAGYVYSGPIAATAYRTLEGVADRIERVVLLGPAHRVPVDGLAVPTVDAFDTPLGPVPIDQEARTAALALPGVHADDRAHASEHSVEVQLPFLLRVLGPTFKVLPLVVGRVDDETVADVIDTLWGGPETLIVVSTDLSHYEDYETAVAKDATTARAIVGKQIAAIGPYEACGAFPVRGLLLAADRHDLDVTLLDLRNSADTAGDRSRVVGYGAFAVG